jgi:hypothetical protein
MVANVDVNIVELYKDKSIARNISLVVSSLDKPNVPWHWVQTAIHLQPTNTCCCSTDKYFYQAAANC